MISTFDELLLAARQQPHAQHLLLVYTQAELPEDSSPAQKAAFEAGSGGALVPVTCVDKSASELTSFADLEIEAQAFVQDWDVLFAAAIDIRPDQKHSDSIIDTAMNQVIERVKSGQIGGLISFDRTGTAISLA